jgi:hypothetical protein
MRYEKALEHGKNVVIADLDAAEVLEPSVGGFDFPAFAMAPQLAFVLMSCLRPVTCTHKTSPL